jgi:hypothetical protein
MLRGTGRMALLWESGKNRPSQAFLPEAEWQAFLPLGSFGVSARTEMQDHEARKIHASNAPRATPVMTTAELT